MDGLEDRSAGQSPAVPDRGRASASAPWRWGRCSRATACGPRPTSGTPTRPGTTRRDRNRRSAGAAALRPESEAGHLPVPVGRAVAARPVRLQADARATARDRAARLGPDGPADHDDDLGPEELPGRAVGLQVRASTARAGPGSASCCRTRRRSPTTSAIIRSMHTEAINHDPAITFVQTGSQLAGRPSMGSWVAYGLGSVNQDLPAFVVLLSRGRTDQPLYDRLWGSGFLPTQLPGRQAPRRQGAGALPGQPGRLLAAPRAGRCSTTSATSTTCTTPRPAIPRSSPASPSTSWPTACSSRSPS